MDYVRTSQIKLKKVLGLTVCSNAALDVSPSTGVLAYPAGCTVVLFNLKKLSQSYLLNTSRKAITAVAYSRCGRYIATGECGLNPTIKVWELDQQNGNFESAAGTIVAEFSGHKYAVNCVAFSPTGKYLVSVGSQHDMIVNVFDWRSNLKIASNKVSAKVVAVSFSEDGNYFVTVGNRHVKYWYLDGGRKYKEPQPIPLMGRSAILGELRNNDFCAVACGKGDKSDSTYAITRNGQLVEFNSRRLLDKWVACRTTSANCICVSGKFILVGCAESIIRCFNAENLEYITTLPRTHYLGVDVSQGVHISHMMSAPNNAKYPDTIAIVFDEQRSKVSCVYNDHSLYIWDLRDIRRIGKSHSFLYHSACIWGVESVPFNYIKTNLSSNLPSDCFLTCSSDDTIRVWGLDGCDVTDIYRKNVYSKDLLKIIYIDNQLNFIKDMDNPILTNEKSSTYDGRNGVRCIKITPDRGHLATGDRSGNIRIYNLTNSKLVTTIEAHDSEVLCLEYTNDKIDKRLLASASRDRLIHIFDCLQGYCILQTLDDHSSSITSVRFIGAGINFQLVSCGADKSIIFRNYQNNQFLRGNNCSGKNTLYDMEVDSNSKHILTACQDRNIRVYGTQNAKHTKTFKGSHSDEGSLIKLSLDLSGIYIATSCTDKTLSVYDYYSNECMARMYGHSELVTGLKFTNDCKHLISASGDGCVFIWQVPHDMIVTMQARLSQQAIRSGHQIQRPLSQPIGDILIEQNNHHNHDKFGSPPNNFIEEQPVSPGGYKFSDVGQLPQWAKRKTSDETQGTHVLSTSPSQTQFENNQKARGRWAQKTQFEPDTMYMKNIMDNPITIPFNNITANNINNINNNNNNNSSDYHSSSSKDVYNNQYLSEDSSIDSGMENRRDIFLSKTLEQKNMNSLNSESNTEHDGDVEDISDGERTSSDHGLVFYPAVSPGTPTNFKVNEINVEELRKSMRRTKLEKLGLVLSPTNQSAPSTGSDDEDEGSTPSGDNADRSLASTLGGSSESIPQQSSSSFLQAALDGPGSLSDKDHRGRKSLSTLHNKDGNVITSISKSFTNSKKEELMKVINEAKQKLENVGYRSNLRTSQSISDLSHSANMDMNYRTSRGPGRTGIHAKSLMSAHDDDSSIIRRACSLSDLSMGKGFKTTTTQLTTTTSSSSSSNYKPTPNNRQNVPVRIQAKRNSLTSKLSSDSEPEHTRGGILRPTISSQNKTNGTTGSSGGGGGGGSGGGGSGSSGGSTQRQYSAVKNSAGIINRRRGLQNSHSSVNLSMVGHDDSSSEETTTPINLPTKPAVPPRPRSISVDHKRFNNINNINNINNNNNVNNSITIKNRSNNNINNNNNNFDISQMDLPCKDTDITSVDVTSQLCSNIINNLMQTTNSVMQLHKRLQHTTEVDQPTTVIGGSRNNNLMLKELENAVIMTQNMLTKITIKNDCNDGQNINYLTNNIHNNTTNTTLLSSSSSMTQLMGSSTTQTQTTTTTAENGDYLQMMDRCSDILNKVHKQM